MRINYFFGTENTICVCFSFRGNIYFFKCNRAARLPLFRRIVARLWFTESRLARVPEYFT